MFKFHLIATKSDDVKWKKNAKSKRPTTEKLTVGLKSSEPHCSVIPDIPANFIFSRKHLYFNVVKNSGLFI